MKLIYLTAAILGFFILTACDPPYQGSKLKMTVNGSAWIADTLVDCYLTAEKTAIITGQNEFSSLSLEVHNVDGIASFSIDQLVYSSSTGEFKIDSLHGTGQLSVQNILSSSGPTRQLIGEFSGTAYTENGQDSVTITNGIFGVE